MRYINIHTHKLNIHENTFEIYNKKITENFTKQHFSSGLHPWFITEKNIQTEFQILKTDLNNKHCIALGEIGLDKLTNTSFEIQKEVFKKQLELNKKIKKPVIIHCVKSFQEIIQITKKYDYSFIIHGYNKKQELANQLLKNGFYLSFGKQLLSKENLQQVFKNTPINKLFLETDDAKISIKKIYNIAAEIKNIPLESLLLALQNNFKTVFYESELVRTNRTFN